MASSSALENYTKMQKKQHRDRSNEFLKEHQQNTKRMDLKKLYPNNYHIRNKALYNNNNNSTINNEKRMVPSESLPVIHTGMNYRRSKLFDQTDGTSSLVKDDTSSENEFRYDKSHNHLQEISRFSLTDPSQ